MVMLGKVARESLITDGPLCNRGRELIRPLHLREVE